MNSDRLGRAPVRVPVPFAKFLSQLTNFSFVHSEILHFENFSIKFLMPRALDDNIHIIFLESGTENPLTELLGRRKDGTEIRGKIIPKRFKMSWRRADEIVKTRILLNGPHGQVLPGSVDEIYLYIDTTLICMIDNRKFFLARQQANFSIFDDKSLDINFHRQNCNF